MAGSLTIDEIERLSGGHMKRPASDVKSRWREIVAEANAHGEVLVTNHSRPEVVVLSVERYSKLRTEALANDPLKTLRAEFDRELAMLRDEKVPAALRRAFRSGPAEIARAANAAAVRGRKR